MDVIGALEMFTYKIGEMVESVSADLDKLTKKAESTRTAVEKAKVEPRSESSGMTNGAVTTPAGRSTAGVGAALGAVTDALTQSEGRLT